MTRWSLIVRCMRPVAVWLRSYAEATSPTSLHSWEKVIPLCAGMLARFSLLGPTFERYLIHVYHRHGKTEEVPSFIKHCAARTRDFDLPFALAQCIGAEAVPRPLQIQAVYISEGKTARYHCIHTIDGQSASTPLKIFEKCISLKTARTRLIAERAVLLNECTDLQDIPTPRLLNVIRGKKCTFLFFEYCDGRPLTRREFRKPYYTLRSCDQSEVIELIARVNRSPTDVRKLREAGFPVSSVASRSGSRLRAHEERAMLDKMIGNHIEGCNVSRARGIIDRYYANIKDIEEAYERLPKVLCHGDIARRNILMAERNNSLFVIDWDVWGVEPAGADLATLSHLRVGNYMDRDVSEWQRRVFRSLIQEYRSRTGFSATEEEIMFACHQFWIASQITDILRRTQPRPLKLIISYMQEVLSIMS